MSLVSLEIKKSENSEYHTMVNFTGKKEAVSLRFNIFGPHHWQKLLKCEEMETTGNKHINSQFIFIESRAGMGSYRN